MMIDVASQEVKFMKSVNHNHDCDNKRLFSGQIRRSVRWKGIQCHRNPRPTVLEMWIGCLKLHTDDSTFLEKLEKGDDDDDHDNDYIDAYDHGSESDVD